MDGTASLISERRRRRLNAAGIDKPYRVVVKLFDNDERAYEFDSSAAAERAWFLAWRSNRGDPTPAVYSVSLEEHDGKHWRRSRTTTPNMRQLRVRHAFRATQMPPKSLTKLRAHHAYLADKHGLNPEGNV